VGTCVSSCSHAFCIPIWWQKKDLWKYVVILTLAWGYGRFDGFTSTFQDKLFKGYNMDIYNQILYVTLCSCGLSLTGTDIPSYTWFPLHSQGHESLGWYHCTQDSRITCTYVFFCFPSFARFLTRWCNCRPTYARARDVGFVFCPASSWLSVWHHASIFGTLQSLYQEHFQQCVVYFQKLQMQ
jgi:hypothetical protein